MAIYRFRVSFEEFDDIHRDIEIRSVQTFEQLHLAIQEAIGFDASKPASFFMSNDNWKKGQEITSHKSGSVNSSGVMLMKDSILSDFIADPHQKIYYMFDAPSQWTFFIELIKILPDSDSGKKYPLCIKMHGDAPKQYLVVEVPKGIADSEFTDDEIFGEEVPETGDETEGEEDDSGGIDSEFTEEVDEEEYDNIEESTEDEPERE